MQSACPQCGAPLRFGGAQSLAAVCSYCRASVARNGVSVELVGQVPDLVSTSTRLAIGDGGTLFGTPFLVVGRLQLDQGAAVWDEWYVHFSDGSDGWLAEAQGALYLTRRTEAPLQPALAALTPGETVTLPGAGEWTVQELGEARVLSAEGELPAPARAGEISRFADLSGDRGRFATLDYGEDAVAPTLFSGKRTSYAEAGLLRAIEARRGAQAAIAGPAGTALTCPSCGAPVPLRLATSRTAVCASCHGLLDVGNGALSLIAKLRERTPPVVPLGSRGKLRGEELEVLGYLRRSVKVTGIEYEWSEWQCHVPGGYRYLSEYNGHWTLLSPLAAADARENPLRNTATDGQRTYAHFQSGLARIRDLQGELSWTARLTDTVTFKDYVAPPFLLSRESERSEVNWTRGEHVEGSEVWQAFSLPGAPPAQSGVGPAQPNPWERAKAHALVSSAAGVFLLLLLAVLFDSVLLPHQKVVELTVPLVEDTATVSVPFELPDAVQAVEVSAFAPIDQAWAGFDAVLINDDNGDAHSAELQVSHFHGYEDGEDWSEGSPRDTATIGSLPRGRYVLRVDVELDPASRRLVPPSATVKLTRGVFLLGPVLLGLFALLPAPLVLTLLRSRFERQRWEESDHSPDEDD